MRSKGDPEFIPCDDMPCRLHGIEIVPPDSSGTTKLLSSKRSFARVRTWYGQESELRFNNMELGIGIQWFFRLTEERRLGTEKILVTSHRRIAIITASSDLMLLVLLGLYQQVEQLRLPSHDFGKVGRRWWRLLGTAGLISPETFRGFRVWLQPSEIKEMSIINHITLLPISENKTL
jgi:hypothetical protein